MSIIEEKNTALAVITPQNVAQYFTSEGLDPIIEKIRAEVKAFKPDISTDAGRKKIGSMSRKVASAKVALDDLGKELVSGLKAQTGAVDTERKRMRDTLDALRDEVRQPLTDWETKEEQRTEEHKKFIEGLNALIILPLEPAIDDMQKRLDSIPAYKERDFQEFSDLAKTAIHLAEMTLTSKIAAMIKQKEDAAELERLKAAEAFRLQKERDDKIAKDAAEAAAAEEAKRAQAIIDKAEQDRKDAEARAKKAEDDAAAAAQKAEDDRIEAEQIAENKRIAATKKANDDQAAAVQAERDRAAAVKKAEDDAAAKRESNKKHCAKINNAALNAIQAVIDTSPSDPAKGVVEAIAKGLIPHVTIAY